MESCNKVSSQPSLLQAEQPQLSSRFLIGEVLQPSDHFRGPSVDLLQQLHVFPVLRASELDRTPSGVSPEQSRGAESPSSICWPHLFWCIPVYSWPSRLQAHVDSPYIHHVQSFSGKMKNSSPSGESQLAQCAAARIRHTGNTMC